MSEDVLHFLHVFKKSGDTIVFMLQECSKYITFGRWMEHIHCTSVNTYFILWNIEYLDILTHFYLTSNVHESTYYVNWLLDMECMLLSTIYFLYIGSRVCRLNLNKRCKCILAIQAFTPEMSKVEKKSKIKIKENNNNIGCKLKCKLN